jgi:uncharacterized protein YejL (UPF0352 family)
VASHAVKKAANLILQALQLHQQQTIATNNSSNPTSSIKCEKVIPNMGSNSANTSEPPNELHILAKPVTQRIIPKLKMNGFWNPIFTGCRFSRGLF